MNNNLSRRDVLKLLGLSLPLMSGCAYLRIDPMSPYLRSESIDSPEKEKEVVSKARLTRTDDGRIRVLFVKGSAYERGYQHGYLLRKEVQENLGYLWDQSLKKFHSEELFAEAYERQRPFIPQEFVDEMQGLAHGSKMPLHIIHAVHALPEITEWGGKRHLKEILDKMMTGAIGTSCSNMCAQKSSTADGKMYTVRILDWGLHKISKLHEYPLITVARPDHGFASANISWVGFIGAVSGMNERGITLGEMGYGDPPGETMDGKPMVFMLREVLEYADSLADVRHIITTSKPTNSFVFVMSDGKRGTAEMYIRDPSRFLVFKQGEEIKGDGHDFPGVKDVVYAGHNSALMGEQLQAHHGQITPEMLMKELIPKFAMHSNFQDVVYAPQSLQFWTTNAKSQTERAAEQLYTFFDLRKALDSFS